MKSFDVRKDNKTYTVLDKCVVNEEGYSTIYFLLTDMEGNLSWTNEITQYKHIR